MLANTNRILVKLRPSIGLAAADPKVNLRPLYDAAPRTNAFGIADAPAWDLAELPDTGGPNPWDLAHAQVADQLGVDESAVLFAEPDLVQSFNDGSEANASGLALAGAPDPCANEVRQDNTHNAISKDLAERPDKIVCKYLLNAFRCLSDLYASAKYDRCLSSNGSVLQGLPLSNP
jgi:hypothetical protein